jgi:hypothetical protein
LAMDTSKVCTYFFNLRELVLLVENIIRQDNGNYLG